MPTQHKVRHGEDISSIAFQHGLCPDTIWSDSHNSQLRELRKDPDVLFPGDIVYLPDRESKTESCQTDIRNRFKRKGVPAKLCLHLFNDDKPRSHQYYQLDIDGHLFEGKTDEQGILKQSIPPKSKHGKLFIDGDEIDIDLGELDPADEVKGLQERLNNLGFDCGREDGDFGDKTKAALLAFEQQTGMRERESIDQEIIDKLTQESEA